jgi:hypothetical protein
MILTANAQAVVATCTRPKPPHSRCAQFAGALPQRLKTLSP